MINIIIYYKNDSVDIQSDGFFIHEVGYILEFSKFGLKNLTLSQKYTLAKVLVDMINKSTTDRVFFVDSKFEIDYPSKLNVIHFYISNRFVPQVLSDRNLNEW